MQVVRPAGEAHAVQQPDQPIVVITMEMRYENMSDLTPPDLVTIHLDLGAFAAIDKEKAVTRRHYLCGGVTIEHGKCGIIAQDGDSQHASGSG